MKLSSRFALDTLFVIGAVFLVVVSQLFSTTVAGWTGFGVFTGLTVLAAASAILTRKAARKIGHSVLAAAGLWSLIATLVFTGPAMIWLVFADALALGALALVDLAAHDVTTENVVHRLEVTEADDSKATAGRAA